MKSSREAEKYCSRSNRALGILWTKVATRVVEEVEDSSCLIIRVWLQNSVADLSVQFGTGCGES